MNHAKLNKLARLHYSPVSDDEDYEPSLKKLRYDNGNTTSLTTNLVPRPSALASRLANEDIADSGVLDDDLGSQAFLEQLFTSRGLSPSLFYTGEFPDGASDIENEEFIPDSQKPELYGSSPSPSPPNSPSQRLAHLSQIYQINVEECGAGITLVEAKEETSAEACRCAAWLFEEYHGLTKCLRQERKESEELVAKNFRQMVRMKRIRDLLIQTLEMYESAVGYGEIKREDDSDTTIKAAWKEVEDARAAQKEAEVQAALAIAERNEAEERAAMAIKSQKETEKKLRAANQIRQNVLSLIQRPY
ncbi:hypothetical protein EV360DRAFT_87391 [Lentinula raphanica]|nr:hypothetical protein EV360DRAFT_87391 [Lentinula raphanica]